MHYPALLKPSDTEVFALATGLIAVPKATPTFARWAGDPPGPNYGRKAILECQGQPVFAELAILRAWEGEGWEGVWVDSFGKRLLTGFWPKPTVKALPAHHRELFDDLSHSTASARCWDVFCWRGDEVAFSEAKLRRHDRVRDTQRAWLAAGLKRGLSLDSFLVVEWSMGASHAAA